MKTFALFILGLGALVGLSAFSAFLLMVLFGIMHAEFGYFAPIGFWSSWGLNFIAGAYVGIGVGATKRMSNG